MNSAVKLFVCNRLSDAIVLYTFVVAVKAPIFIALIGNGRGRAVFGFFLRYYLRSDGYVNGKTVLNHKRRLAAFYFFGIILAVFFISLFKVGICEIFIISKLDVF